MNTFGTVITSWKSASPHQEYKLSKEAGSNRSHSTASHEFWRLSFASPHHSYRVSPLPPPPRVIHCFDVPRYMFTNLTRCQTARRQEQIWVDDIRRRYSCQTVRTVCRLPRIFRMTEARDIRRFEFDSYVKTLGIDEQQTLRLATVAMKVLLLRVISPKRVAALGGLMECQSCGVVGATLNTIRHRNCLWAGLASTQIPANGPNRTSARKS
jgi:hypothetical protein